MTSDTWRGVVGLEEYYEANYEGEVRSLGRVITTRTGQTYFKPGRVMSQSRRSDGHLQLTFKVNGKAYTRKLHRIIAEAFIGPCPEGMEVCHNDGDPANNRVDNLRYGTRSENMYDRVSHGDHPFAAKSHCLRGHELRDPNLTPSMSAKGFRNCLACSRGRARVQYHPHLKSNLQSITDDYYHKIMKETVKNEH